MSTPSEIQGNITGCHTIPNRSDLVLLVVSAGNWSGQYTCSLAKVTLDDNVPNRLGNLTDFLVTRSYSAVILKGISEDVVGIREVKSMRIVTIESPIQYKVGS